VVNALINFEQCKDFRTGEIWVNRGDLETACAAQLRIS